MTILERVIFVDDGDQCTPVVTGGSFTILSAVVGRMIRILDTAYTLDQYANRWSSRRAMSLREA